MDAHDKLPNYYEETRPWGAFTRFTHGEPTSVKFITVKPGEAFSLQTHERRDEFWKVISGSGTFRIGDAEHEVHVGDEAYIPRETLHRATGGTEDLTFIEIAFGEFDENDIKRFEDKYGRA